MWCVGILRIALTLRSPNLFISFKFMMCWSLSISTNFTKISAVAPASSTARWWFSNEIPSAFATRFNLYFERVGSSTRARATVSTDVNSRSRPSTRQFCSINPTSNPALCATNAPSPINSRNCGSTTSIVGASSTISSVILVRFVISKGIGRSGFTKVLNLSTICPFSTFTAPISIILSRIELNPVVSISKTI